MPNTEEIVINTSPMIALVAALGDLQVLKMYQRVLVPFEVHQELMAGGAAGFAVPEFEAAHWLSKRTESVQEGYTFSMREAIDRMTAKGIRLSRRVIQFALDQSGENA
jgi:predicted nucleic acid-binding protein